MIGGILHMLSKTVMSHVSLLHLEKRLISSPFYRRKFPVGISEFNSFEDIPLTTKEELRSAGSMGLLAVERSLISHYHESSGTTGQPSSSWFTREDVVHNAQQINLSGLKLHKEDLVLIRFPYALFLPAYLIQEASYQCGAGIVPASSRNNVTTYPKILQLMKDLEVTVFAGLPRELELLAETARLLDIDIQTEFPKLRGVWVAGELLTPNRKFHLEQLWGIPVYNLYGSTETGNIAVMCSEGRLHYSEDDYFIEVFDEHMNTVPQGERGQAVITTLRHEGSPLLRYANGDIISVHPSRCACGSTDQEIRHYGRMSERMNSGNQMMDSYDIQEVLYGLDPVPIAWSVRERDNDCELVLEYSDEQYSNEEKLKQYLYEDLGPGYQPTFVRENSLLDRSELLVSKSSRKPQYFLKMDEIPELMNIEEGQKQFLASDYAKAIENFQQAIKINPEQAEAYAWLAACYGKLIDQGNLLVKISQLPNLKRTAAMAVQKDRFSPMARGVSGLVQLKTPEDFGGNVRQALREFKLSIYLGSLDPDVWIYLAEAYFKLNEGSAAREALKRGLQLQPEHVDALALLKKLDKKG
jgi:phenylacetate-CoA ligase